MRQVRIFSSADECPVEVIWAENHPYSNIDLGWA
jgi:hypothetical protein